MVLRKLYSSLKASVISKTKCIGNNAYLKLMYFKGKEQLTRQNMKIWSKDALKLANLACQCHLFASNVAGISVMTGPSMLPTFQEMGAVIEDHWTIRCHPENISRGDVVTLYSPLHPNRVVCKRILGLPGDIICVDPTGRYASSTEHVQIPKGHVWIVGDNCTVSRDSRTYGPVSISLLRSKVRAIVWPPRDIGLLPNPVTIIS